MIFWSKQEEAQTTDFEIEKSQQQELLNRRHSDEQKPAPPESAPNADEPRTNRGTTNKQGSSASLEDGQRNRLIAGRMEKHLAMLICDILVVDHRNKKQAKNLADKGAASRTAAEEGTTREAGQSLERSS